MTLTPQEMEDEGICQACGGKGRYQRRTENSENESVDIVECGPCEGTGLVAEDGDVD